jgi:putative transposase
LSGEYKLAWLCEALLVSRSGYYDWKERRCQPGKREVENIHLRARIRQEFARSRQTYGSPRLAHALGCPGRRNRIARLMRLERIFARQRSKYRPATTDSRHGGPIAPNRLQGLAIQRSNQVWVSDATGVLTSQGWLYLVAVLDVFTRRVMVQHGLIASMSRKGNCYDNAFIESFWSSLKYELVYHQRFATLAQARTAIFDYIETFYNRTRLHSSLDYLSPTNFESQLN